MPYWQSTVTPMTECPKAPRPREWQTVYENGIPVRMVWLGPQPVRVHKLVALLHGFQRCLWCGEVFQPAEVAS